MATSFVKGLKCYICGDLLDSPEKMNDNSFSRDHVVASSKGGKSTLSCCRRCNQLKNSLPFTPEVDAIIQSVRQCEKEALFRAKNINVKRDKENSNIIYGYVTCSCDTYTVKFDRTSGDVSFADVHNIAYELMSTGNGSMEYTRGQKDTLRILDHIRPIYRMIISGVNKYKLYDFSSIIPNFEPELVEQFGLLPDTVASETEQIPKNQENCKCSMCNKVVQGCVSGAIIICNECMPLLKLLTQKETENCIKFLETFKQEIHNL